MKKVLSKFASSLAFAALALAINLNISVADDSVTEATVRSASMKFVENFNSQDAEALGFFYTQSASLKLPDLPAVSGRQDIRSAWQAGFDAGLGQLELTVESIEDIALGKVLENGTFVLEINTPDGLLVQTGTYSVQWEYNPFLFYYFRIVLPQIDFDAIDASSTVSAG